MGKAGGVKIQEPTNLECGKSYMDDAGHFKKDPVLRRFSPGTISIRTYFTGSGENGHLSQLSWLKESKKWE